jgi:hypothetical protein
MKVACCVCHKQRINDIWITKEPLNDINISHGYCPDCLKVILDRFKKDNN